TASRGDPVRAPKVFAACSSFTGSRLKLSITSCPLGTRRLASAVPTFSAPDDSDLHAAFVGPRPQALHRRLIVGQRHSYLSLSSPHEPKSEVATKVLLVGE